MVTLQNITYRHADKQLLFNSINFAVNKGEKIALIGKNGSGKSTLLKLIVKKIEPSSGAINLGSSAYYVPQIFGQFDNLTIGEALSVSQKITALREILNGNVTESNLEILNDDWDVEERCRFAMQFWELGDFNFDEKMSFLSGGQQTKVFLAGLLIHKPDLAVLDEPSNHLDRAGRDKLSGWLKTTTATVIIVTHDRELLNLVQKIAELHDKGISNFNGNYSDYLIHKDLEQKTLSHGIHDKERALRKAKIKERETNERQQKLDSRGKGKKEKSGVARIMMNTLRNNAENSSAKLKNVHEEKMQNISQELRQLRSELPDIDKMKLGIRDSSLHKGKILFKGQDLNYSYGNLQVWKENLNFEITSGERIGLEGQNGSGKTTFLKMLTGELQASAGNIYRSEQIIVYVDQNYSYLDEHLTIYEQAQKSNTSRLEEHEVRIRLNRFLFAPDNSDKLCQALSGGERMRLVLCCMMMSIMPPDVIILDEPTNNLDLQNIDILTATIKDYKGTLIVVSHDLNFTEDIGIGRTIVLR